MISLLIHNGGKYDPYVYGPEDFTGPVLIVDYTVETQKEICESHGFHEISNTFIEVKGAYLAYYDGHNLVKTKLSDDNVVLALLNKIHD